MSASLPHVYFIEAQGHHSQLGTLVHCQEKSLFRKSRSDLIKINACVRTWLIEPAMGSQGQAAFTRM